MKNVLVNGSREGKNLRAILLMKRNAEEKEGELDSAVFARC
jgi:hypothetical protein